MKTDLQLQQEIFNEFRKEPILASFEPEITVQSGVVTLSGDVDCYTKQVIAENIVKRLPDVKVIIQEIKVRIPFAVRVSDTEITQIVLNVLNWNCNVPDSSIEVDVRKGWVTLSGELDWEYQKDSAIMAIRDIVGLKGITDLLTIKKGICMIPGIKPDNAMAQPIPGVERQDKHNSFSVFCSKMYGKISCFFEPEEVEVTFKEAFGKKVRYTYTKQSLKELYIAHRS